MKRSKPAATANVGGAGNKSKEGSTDEVPSDSPLRKKKYNFSKRKAKFTRERYRPPPSPEAEVISSRGEHRSAVPTPHRVPERRITRRTKEKPTCLLFGRLREVLYPDHFFCSNCKNYEDCLSSGAIHGKLNRQSTRFRCTAHHTDFFLPTHPRKIQYINEVVQRADQSVAVIDESSCGSSEDESDCKVEYDDSTILEDFKTLQEAFEGVQRLLLEREKNDSESREVFVNHVKSVVQERLAAELVGVQQYIESLKSSISTLRATVNKQATIINRYKRRMSEEKAESVPLNLGIVMEVNKLVSSHQRYKLLSNKNKASLVAKAVMDPNLCDGIAFEEIINQCKTWLRRNVFKPEEILKQMDLRGGTLNYEGLKVLNDVEASAYIGNKKRIRNRLLCTPSCLKRVARKLEQAAVTICPYQQISTPFGEGVELDYAKVTRLVINCFGLEQIAAEQPVNISASIDAARVTKNLSHTSAGLKMSDPRARDPIKNMRSFAVDGDSLRDLQSYNNVFLMKIILTKETKESFKEFDDIFQFFRLAELPHEQRQDHHQNKEKFQWEHIRDLHPLSVTFTTDMAADWKLVGTGGGVKNTEMFCTLCPCTSSCVHQPNPTRCERFCAHREEGWQCYHHPIATQEVKQGLEDDVRELQRSLQADLEDIEHNSKIRYYVNTPLEVARRTPNSISFEPSTQDEKDEFLDLIMDELILRGINPVGDLEALRQRLSNELLLEHKLRQHLKKLQHCSTLEQCLIVLLHKVPDIMHCENRIGLKLLSMVLREGFDNAKKGFLFGAIRSEAERIQRYVEHIEKIFNTTILGDEDGPAQWCLPYDKDNKTVGIICLDNNRIRKVIMEYEALVQASVHDNARSEKYRVSIHHYRIAISILREKREFTDDRIKEFQLHVDEWFQLWNKLWSFEGCTNYTHVLSSAHMCEFMYKWRNLYRFSQQGWEKFNHIFSTFYFRRTNHGGKRHADSIKSKLVPIAKWLQRRLLWLTNAADNILNHDNINEDDASSDEDDAD
jgi:hypothetical protein